jgi:hypothetical protein
MNSVDFKIKIAFKPIQREALFIVAALLQNRFPTFALNFNLNTLN